MKHLAQKDRVKKFIYFDIEATDWSNVTCVVARSEPGDTICVHSIAQLLTAAEAKGWLTHKHTWLAHYGGIYDFLVCIAEMLPQWSIYSACHGSGSGTWKIELRKGGLVLQLLDSSRMIPGGLRKWGEKLGDKKGDLDRTKIGSYTWAELIEYCTNDVKILQSVHQRCRLFWKTLYPGCEPAATLPGTIARVIRREYLPVGAWDWDPKIDEIVAQAYYGGRTERFFSYLANGVEHDINGSYPAAMCGDLPTRFLGVSRRLRSEATDIVHATVSVPDSTDIPVLPMRCDIGALAGKLIFPTGKLTGWWTGEELRYAISVHAASIEKLHAVYEYDSAPFLEPLMRQLHEFRRTADQLDSTFAKLAANSVSGKFIERGEYSDLTQDLAKVARNLAGLQSAYDDALPPPYSMPRVYSVTAHNEQLDICELFSNVTPGLRHAAAAAHITARGRIALHRGLLSSDAPVYCDTDSVHAANGVKPDLCSDTELGKFKFVGPINRGEYLAPKLYAYFRDDKFVCHAKGLRLGCKDGESEAEHMRRVYQAWLDIRGHKSIEYETTRLLKRSLMQGSVEFKRFKSVWKRNPGIDKRCISKTSSRPWRIDEIPTLKVPRAP